MRKMGSIGRFLCVAALAAVLALGLAGTALAAHYEGYWG